MTTQECIDKIVINLNNDISKLGNKYAVAIKYGQCGIDFSELYCKIAYKDILECYNVFSSEPEDMWVISSDNETSMTFTTSDSINISLSGTIEDMYKYLFNYENNDTFSFSYDEDNLYIWSYEAGASLETDSETIDPISYNLDEYIKAIEAMNCFEHYKIREIISTLNY